MKTYSAVIYTDHALTKKTQNDFEVCEIKSGYVRRLGAPAVALGFLDAWRTYMMVHAFARDGKFYDKGYWLVSMTTGKKWTFRMLPLETM